MISRLAPSPTGVLHLGNARTFLINWLWVRAAGGTLLLRIEDIDGPRVKPEAVAATLEDLRWLGLDWDGEPLLQSGRGERHRQAVDELLARGLAYPCVCSRKEVEEAASAPHEQDPEGVVYPGTCRGRWADRESAAAATGRDPAIRLRVEGQALPFEDLVAGPQDGRLQGDYVIEKRDRSPAYQLAVVVDDAESGVDHVLRAADLLPSTPRQLLLYRHFGWHPPRHAHVPLVVGADGRRLAKRHGDTSLRHLRDQGVAPGEVLTWLGRSMGLEVAAVDAPVDLLSRFELASVPRHPLVWREELSG